MSEQLYPDLSPRLYGLDDHPPPGVWDIQVPYAPTLVAWLAAAGPDTPGVAGLSTIAGNIIVHTVLRVLTPRVPLVADRHGQRDPYPHIHVHAAREDLDGHPVTREHAQAAADEAWIAGLDRAKAFTERHPEHSITWDEHGIVGVDHSRIGDFSCTRFPQLVRVEAFEQRREGCGRSAPHPQASL